MPKATNYRHKPFRGQSALIHGALINNRPATCPCDSRLTITLSGPAGCGKSLVAKILRAVLPLTPVNEVVIVETNA